MYLEVVALIIYCEKGWNKERITLWQLGRVSLAKIFSFFQLKRIAVFILLLAVFILVNYMFFLYLFGFPILLFTDSSFCVSWRESLKLLRKVCIFSYSVIFFLMLFLIWLAGVLSIAAEVRYFRGISEGRWVFGLFYDTFTGVWNLLSGALISVFFCALSIVLYHGYKGDCRIEAKKKKRTIKYMTARVTVVSAIIVFLVFLGDTELGRQIISPNKQAHAQGKRVYG